MQQSKVCGIRKSPLAAAMAISLGASMLAGVASADIITFSFTGGPNGGAFTLINPTGAPLVNSDYGADTNYYGWRTPVSGTMTYNTATGVGSMTIAAFSFQAGGAALASNISLRAIGDGAGGSGNLILGNMLFDWSGTFGIPVSTVWDATGLLSAIAGGLQVGNTVSGGGTPESDNTKFGSGKNTYTLPLGPAPLAVTDWNTTTVGGTSCGLGCNPSGTLPLVADNATDNASEPAGDIGIGASPMPAGPFPAWNANFDFMGFTVTAYTDTTPPVVTLNGSDPQNVPVGGTYTEAGATCVDAHDDPDPSVVIDSSAVDTNTTGSYNVTYTCTDAASNQTVETREVIVGDPDAPVITLLGSASLNHECGSAYTDAGATAVDPNGGPGGTPLDISGSIVTNPAGGAIDVSSIAVRTITYNVTDAESKPAAQRTRSVNVRDTTQPTINISGSNPLNLLTTDAGTFTAPSATASDACDPSVPVGAPSGTVNFSVPAGLDTVNSALLYTATDDAGNTRNTTLNVVVTRAEPVLTLLGDQTMTLNIGETFVDPGVSVHDVQSGDATYTGAGVKTGAFPNAIVIGGSGAGLHNTVPAPGNYTITYNVTDPQGNAATQVTRTLIVGAAFSAENSNFTMINPNGFFVGGASDIIATWDGTVYTDPVTQTAPNMLLRSAKPTPFSGFVWTAHDVRVFGPGTYSFETCPAPIVINSVQKTAIAADDSTSCADFPGGVPTAKNTILTATVPAGHLGAHMLFDWGGVDNTKACGVSNCNIDVFVVWKPDGVFAGSPADSDTNLGAKGTTFDLASIDPDGDGKPGVSMVDGAFVNFNANFNLDENAVVQPPPEPVDWNVGNPSAGGGGGAAGIWSVMALVSAFLARIRRRTFR